MNIKNRLAKLEKQSGIIDPARPVWAELDNDGAVLRYADGKRVPVAREEIPQGVKMYQGWSPDDWRATP